MDNNTEETWKKLSKCLAVFFALNSVPINKEKTNSWIRKKSCVESYTVSLPMSREGMGDMCARKHAHISMAEIASMLHGKFCLISHNTSLPTGGGGGRASGGHGFHTATLHLQAHSTKPHPKCLLLSRLSLYITHFLCCIQFLLVCGHGELYSWLRHKARAYMPWAACFISARHHYTPLFIMGPISQHKHHQNL